MSELTERDMKLLKAVARGLNEQSSAWNIASRMGYRPSRHAIPAVTQMCRSINRRFPYPNPSEYEADAMKFGDLGKYLVRLPPQDRWASAIWCLTKAGSVLVAGTSADLAKERL